MVIKLQDPDQTPLPYVISPTEASLVGSLMLIGSTVSFSIGFISNSIGRRRALILGDFFIFLAFFMLNWPLNLTMIYIARIILGFGMGFIAIVNMVYIGEISTPNLRGVILTSTGVFHGLGSLLVLSTAPYLPYHKVGYVIIPIVLVHLLGTLYIPESPIYHVIKGNEEAARKSLQKLGRDKNIEIELKAMITRAQEQQDSGKISELFTYKSNRRAFIICSVLMIIQQTNGTVAVTLFATTIFEQAGSYIRADISTIVIGMTSLCGTILAPVFVERCGRKILLIVSTGCCCLSMATLGTYFYLVFIENPSVSYIGWLPLTSLIVALFTFGIGLNIIPNSITGEMFRSNLRSVGTSTAMSLSWAVGLVSTTAFGFLVVALGNHVTFWMFAVVNALGLVFTVLFVPETKGKSLTEIEDMLENQKTFMTF